MTSEKVTLPQVPGALLEPRSHSRASSGGEPGGGGRSLLLPQPTPGGLQRSRALTRQQPRSRAAHGHYAHSYGPDVWEYPDRHAPPGRTHSRQTARSMPARLTPLTPRAPVGGLFTPTRDISAKYAKFYDSSRGAAGTPYGFIKRSSSEECLKCMLKIPHDKCEAHKYIRVGGGYRHSYWYCKALIEEIMLQKAKEEVLERRLDAIHERHVKTIKTYIRTKSGRLVERMIFLSEEDYALFRRGGKDALDILAKYLSKDDMKNIDSYEKDEQKALTTWIRTFSGRRIQKTVYVSREEYDAMKRGELDAKDVLKKYMNKEDVDRLEGWGEAEMKQIKTYVRTKSGRMIEKIVVVTAEDYEKMQELKAQGKDPNDLLKKYMSLEDGQQVEGWKKEEAPPMKVVKAKVRTKSGRLIEQTILMTEQEYAEFQASGGGTEALRKYLDVDKDAVIEDWEKASTVYADSDDEDVKKAKDGAKIIGKDGNMYKVVVDPLTGKKYKKKIGRAPGFEHKVRGKVGRGRILGEAENRDPNERGMTKDQVAAYRAGRRRDGSDSEYSYRSDRSAGGTRRVFRKKKNADGTYGKEEAYDEDADPEGRKRRQKRRDTRKQAAIKQKKKALAKGKRDGDSDGSEFSYRSVVSAGGTRKVTRRKKNADGTYGDEESYHSSQDEDGEKRRKNRRAKRVEDIKKGKRNADSDSDYSYRSVHSAGGTRKVLRRKKNKDGTYGKEEAYDSDKDIEGKERRRERREQRQKAFKEGKRRDDSDSDYSYRSLVSAGGTRHVMRRRKRGDGTYSAEHSYHSSDDMEGETRRRRRRRDRKHAGSAHSYYSVRSAGGTRHVRRRRRHADGTYSSSESYHSGDSDFFTKKRKHQKGGGPDGNMTDFSDDLQSTDEEQEPDLSLMTAAEKKEYLEKKAQRKAAREEKRKERYGDKYEEMNKKHKLAKAAKALDKAERMTDFSDDLKSTDSEDEPDLNLMTAAERKEYLEKKAKRKAVREEKRKEKYGDKYETMKEKHKEKKLAKKLAKAERMTDFSDDLKSTDSENEPDLNLMTESERKEYLEKKAKRKAAREEKRKERYGDKYDKMVEKHKQKKLVKALAKAEKMTDFSDDLKSTDSENEPDLNLMTESEKKKYLADKAKRKSEREKKRKEKYGDKYDTMKAKSKEKKLAKALAKAERMTDFSDKSTDSENEPDLNLMSEAEKKEYLEKKAERKAEREKKRKEKYGDKYDDMMDKHKKKKMAKALAKAERLTDFSDDLRSTDSENEPDLNLMSEKEKKKYLADKAKRKEEREKKRKEKYGDKYDDMMLKHEKAKAAKKMLKAERMTDFSDDLQSTDSEMEPDMAKMTAEEKEQYLEAKAKRKEEREKKRKEKYGDKYEEMMEKHEKAKEAKKQAKSMVDYAKAAKRFNPDVTDDRGIGPGHKNWNKKKKKDGNEADSESEDGALAVKGKHLDGKASPEIRVISPVPKQKRLSASKRNALANKPVKPPEETKSESDGEKRKKKKKKRVTSAGSEVSVESYFDVDEDGKVKLKDGMKKIDLNKLDDEDLKKLGIDPTNMTKEEIARALKEKFGGDLEIIDKGQEFDDGNYFEVGEDGKVKLKSDSKKIDLSKLSEEDLKKMGIDTENMTKEEIARKLKDMFGEDVEITDKGQEFDDGNYFEIGADGKVKLKDASKKIDMSKLSKEDLKKMGIDPDNMTKEEVARKLKSMFGEDVDIVDKGEVFDDGDYFTVGADGKITMKKGKTKIDLSKLSEDDLKKMGIDASKLTKEELARAIKEKLGADVEFTEGGKQFDDGDYFEFSKDGTVKLKGGKKKLDLSKMSKEDLRKLGIDTKYMTKDQIAKKLREKFGGDVEVVDGNESDGDYFETTCDGKVKLKAGKKKIDISKLTSDDLEKLGIDPNASKEEIARALKDKFGDAIQIERDGVKIGLKKADEFASDADTDDMAGDSDLDVSTLKGARKVAVMMKRGGGMMQEHMLTMINASNLIDHTHPEERDTAIDFLHHYQLVDGAKIEAYARAYVVEDDDLDYKISSKAAKEALEAVPSVKDINDRQKDYIFTLLDLDDNSQLTFRMFAVMTALAERVTAMDHYCRELLRIANLTDIERKMGLYKNMFYQSSGDDSTTPNFIKVDDLQIDLMAGGLSWEQQDYVIKKLQPNEYREISFLDYLAYIPLFLSMHDRMVDNPLDMSSNKYHPRPLSGQQRDMNPLGHPLRTTSVFSTAQREQDEQAGKLLAGKDSEAIKKQQLELYNKYQKLPHIAHSNPVPGSKPKRTKALF